MFQPVVILDAKTNYSNTVVYHLTDANVFQNSIQAPVDQTYGAVGTLGLRIASTLLLIKLMEQWGH